MCIAQKHEDRASAIAEAPVLCTNVINKTVLRFNSYVAHMLRICYYFRISVYIKEITPNCKSTHNRGLLLFTLEISLHLKPLFHYLPYSLGHRNS